ncbi:MAG: hypothetical protein GEV09_14385, partial [Pseudonocardiaceae bacterium]|nr:hypothetical protein [Pseudonocardiaceae bacterium]
MTPRVFGEFDIHVREEVAGALDAGHPVVALESTLLAHGLPPGRNREVAGELEAAVRRHGAVPATVAVLDGRVRIGLDGPGLDRVCDPAAGLRKLAELLTAHPELGDDIRTNDRVLVSVGHGIDTVDDL